MCIIKKKSKITLIYELIKRMIAMKTLTTKLEEGYTLQKEMIHKSMKTFQYTATFRKQ